MIQTRTMNDAFRTWLIDAVTREWGEDDVDFVAFLTSQFNAVPNGTSLPVAVPEDIEDERTLTPAQSVTLTVDYYVGHWTDSLTEEES